MASKNFGGVSSLLVEKRNFLMNLFLHFTRRDVQSLPVQQRILFILFSALV